MDPNPSPREEGPSMRLLFLLVVLALGGCRNDSGSVGNRQPGRTNDPPIWLCARALASADALVLADVEIHEPFPYE